MTGTKWNTLQQEQIDLGMQAGLTQAQIAMYARHRYTFLQMQEIRTALEEGIDPKRVKAMCRPWLSDTEMEQIRIRLEQGEQIRAGFDLRKVCAVTALTALGAALILDGYVRASDQVYFNLTQPSVTLCQGEMFEPMKYVASYSDKADKLALPSAVDTETPGTKAAVYRLKAGREEITRILLVTVEGVEEG